MCVHSAFGFYEYSITFVLCLCGDQIKSGKHFSCGHLVSSHKKCVKLQKPQNLGM
jgi:hypothetical protein